MANKIPSGLQTKKIETTRVEPSTKDNQKFRLFFIGKKDDDVQILDVSKIDYEFIKNRLENETSIFIERILQPKNKSNLIEFHDSWFFPHM